MGLNAECGLTRAQIVHTYILYANARKAINLCVMQPNLDRYFDSGAIYLASEYGMNVFTFPARAGEAKNVCGYGFTHTLSSKPRYFVRGIKTKHFVYFLIVYIS